MKSFIQTQWARDPLPDSSIQRNMRIYKSIKVSICRRDTNEKKGRTQKRSQLYRENKCVSSCDSTIHKNFFSYTYGQMASSDHQLICKSGNYLYWHFFYCPRKWIMGKMYFSVQFRYLFADIYRKLLGNSDWDWTSVS